MCDSRGLRPGGVLSELAVMDGEIWTKVAAELQRTDAAERGHSVTTATPHCSLVLRSSDLLFYYLTRASTVSEEMVGDGAMMTSGSPSNMSSQRMCRWTRTDWKHLRRSKVFILTVALQNQTTSDAKVKIKH